MHNNVIFTIGYSGFGNDVSLFILSLRHFDINALIDVRSTPYSSFFTAFNKEALEASLSQAGIVYRNCSKEFGARQDDKRLYPNGYLDFEMFAKTPQFRDGVNKIVDGISKGFRFALSAAEADPNLESFCFEDPVEMGLYLSHCNALGKNKTVVWNASSDYSDRCKTGYDLFEQSQFEQALEAYQDALTVNPVGITARFEICECYLSLGRLSEARQCLLDMQEYLVKAEDAARFYRRMGYIATEQADYKLAVACLLFSRNYERSSYVINELMYIFSITKGQVKVPDPKQVLIDAGLPILEAVGIKGRDA